MPVFRHAFPLVLSLLTVSSIAVAQPESPPVGGAVAEETTPATSLPDAETIFERHIEAMGGRDAVFAIENRRVKGIYTGIPFLFPVRLEIWQDAPNKFRMRLDEPAGRTIEIRYDGESGWRMISGQGVEKLEGVSLRELIDTADFYGQANYRERYESVQTVGEGEVDGEPVYMIRAIWPDGHTQSLFFLKESGLYFGSRYATAGPDGQAREVVVLVSEYEDAGGGTLYPTKVRQILAGETAPVELEYRSVKSDVEDGYDDYGKPEAE